MDNKKWTYLLFVQGVKKASSHNDDDLRMGRKSEIVTFYGRR